MKYEAAIHKRPDTKPDFV
jgi:arginyl-tRNA---protein transferase